jgi:hypothetical protein
VLLASLTGALLADALAGTRGAADAPSAARPPDGDDAGSAGARRDPDAALPADLAALVAPTRFADPAPRTMQTTTEGLRA